LAEDDGAGLHSGEDSVPSVTSDSVPSAIPFCALAEIGLNTDAARPGTTLVADGHGGRTDGDDASAVREGPKILKLGEREGGWSIRHAPRLPQLDENATG